MLLKEFIRHNFWWVPFLVAVHTMAAFFSYKIIQDKEHVFKWQVVVYLLMIIPIWPVICKFYERSELMFIGGVYDIMLLCSYQFVWIYFGCAEHFSNYNWLGFILLFVGLVLMKV